MLSQIRDALEPEGYVCRRSTSKEHIVLSCPWYEGAEGPADLGIWYNVAPEDRKDITYGAIKLLLFYTQLTTPGKNTHTHY